jgi:hypothetical protein
MGLILGAIWTAASGVYNSNRLRTANTELLTIVQGIKTLYATQTSFGAAGTNLTPAVAVAGIAPASLTSGTTIYSPWNGNSGVAATNGLVFVTADTVSVAGDSVTITFADIPASACTALLTNASGATSYDNYAATAVTAATAKGATAPSVPTTALTPQTGAVEGAPVTAAAAQTACGTAFDTLGIRFTK